MGLLQKVQKTVLSTQVGGGSEVLSNQNYPQAQKTQQSEQDFREDASLVPARTNCRVARNDFETVLQDSQVGCWQAEGVNARNKILNRTRR